MNELKTLKNGHVKIKNSFYITVFDKGDEATLNDYEDILNGLNDNGDLKNDFMELLQNFITENPIDVGSDVREEWNDLNTDDRLVYESPIPLNEEQRKIISSLNNPKSRFITVQGPPGTGKSHTISAILFQAISNKKSVLLLSDKKEALDVVEDKLNQTLNKVRVNEDPLLRIGKTGNSYSKFLLSNLLTTFV